MYILKNTKTWMKLTQNTLQKFHLATECSLKRMLRILCTDYYWLLLLCVFGMRCVVYIVYNCGSHHSLDSIWRHCGWPFTIILQPMRLETDHEWFFFFFIRPKIVHRFNGNWCVRPSKRLINCNGWC